EGPLHDRPHQSGPAARRLARRLHAPALEALVRRRLHRHQAAPSFAAIAARTFGPTIPAPAPGTSSSAGTMVGPGPPAACTAAAMTSTVIPGIGSSPAA